MTGSKSLTMPMRSSKIGFRRETSYWTMTLKITEDQAFIIMKKMGA